MALIVFSAPEEVGDPPNTEYLKDGEDYVERVKAWAKKNGKGEYAGEEISFPHADGYARYVVLRLKPTMLIHLAVGDAWHYPYIERLTAQDIIDRVEKSKNWPGNQKAFNEK